MTKSTKARTVTDKQRIEPKEMAAPCSTIKSVNRVACASLRAFARYHTAED